MAMTQYPHKYSLPIRNFPLSSTKISAYTHSHRYQLTPSPPSSPHDEEPPHYYAKKDDKPILSPSDKSDILSKYIHVQVHPNGGASIVHMDQLEFEQLPPRDIDFLVEKFFEKVFEEDSEGYAYHVMGVVHNGAKYLPELVRYFGENHPDVPVKMGNLRNPEIETTTFSEFCSRVSSSYSKGTFRCGPLLQVTLVQQVSEEAGRYFPDFLGKCTLLL